MNQRFFYWICIFVLFLIWVLSLSRLNLVKWWTICNWSISWWVYDLYNEKARCIDIKSQLIVNWNTQYQNRNDELLNWTKKNIENINAELSKIDNSISNTIPRAFR